jgi:hypothetical protein
MRVICRGESDEFVGSFEPFRPRPNVLLVRRFDKRRDLVEETCIEGFRETVAWFYAAGAVRFECQQEKGSSRISEFASGPA